WEELDVILFSGDAYVDHPSFGAAVIGRLIESKGLKVAIVPQPNWRDDLRDFKKLGKPRLFFGVTSGCMDSMVNHYTANKRLRSDDAYTPGGKAGFRPDYAVTVYSTILKDLFPDVPVIIGGIEASLRRVTHYDYWSDSLKPSILVDSKADLLVYGMGERPLLEIIRLMGKGVPVQSLTNIPQTSFIQTEDIPVRPVKLWEEIEIASHETCLNNKKSYAANFKIIEEESNKWNASRILQKHGKNTIVINPPFPPMEDGELDASFDLPFTRLPHPKYENKGAIQAFEMIKFSVNLHRGCFGGCSFCTISAHQGKFIASRSKESILKEVDQITLMPDFKGYISDLGGPSANMYMMKGRNLKICERCRRPSCIYPKVCENLNTDHTAMLDIYNSVDSHPKVKKSFVGSGIRYDMLLNEHAPEPERRSHEVYTRDLIQKHVSGRLKVAPEHTTQQVLNLMRKPSFELFKKFKKKFDRYNTAAGLKQQIIPYFISSHPGSTEEDMASLAVETKNQDFKLEQVQDFTPTPMTVATVIYYSGYNPITMEKVYTARSKNEKLNQRMFFFWYKREFRHQIESRLEKMGRKDLKKKLFETDNGLAKNSKKFVPHHARNKNKTDNTTRKHT
ncbi:MAG: YgiQ family radical SAM protein, partial [Bacteroidales bacterium]|nr:YgiQ family radical SAM protein [Bacteroidales bacterium]